VSFRFRAVLGVISSATGELIFPAVEVDATGEFTGSAVEVDATGEFTGPAV
jgi:hypothetical protein